MLRFPRRKSPNQPLSSNLRRDSVDHRALGALARATTNAVRVIPQAESGRSRRLIGDDVRHATAVRALGDTPLRPLPRSTDKIFDIAKIEALQESPLAAALRSIGIDPSEKLPTDGILSEETSDNAGPSTSTDVIDLVFRPEQAPLSARRSMQRRPDGSNGPGTSPTTDRLPHEVQGAVIATLANVASRGGLVAEVYIS